MASKPALIKFKQADSTALESANGTVQLEVSSGTTKRKFTIVKYGGETDHIELLIANYKQFLDYCETGRINNHSRFASFKDTLKNPSSACARFKGIIQAEFRNRNQQTNANFQRAFKLLIEKLTNHRNPGNAQFIYMSKLKYIDSKTNGKLMHPIEWGNRVETLYDIAETLPYTGNPPSALEKARYTFYAFPVEWQMFASNKRGEDILDDNGGGANPWPIERICRLMEDKFDLEKHLSNKRQKLDGNNRHDRNGGGNCNQGNRCGNSGYHHGRQQFNNRGQRADSRDIRGDNQGENRGDNAGQQRADNNQDAGSRECGIHGGHPWKNCRLNPYNKGRGSNAFSMQAATVFLSNQEKVNQHPWYKRMYENWQRKQASRGHSSHYGSLQGYKGGHPPVQPPPHMGYAYQVAPPSAQGNNMTPTVTVSAPPAPTPVTAYWTGPGGPPTDARQNRNTEQNGGVQGPRWVLHP